MQAASGFCYIIVYFVGIAIHYDSVIVIYVVDAVLVLGKQRILAIYVQDWDLIIGLVYVVLGTEFDVY